MSPRVQAAFTKRALVRTPEGRLAIRCGCGARPEVDGPGIVTCSCDVRYDPQGHILSGFRRICSACCMDLGPASPDVKGDSHGMCEPCAAAWYPEAGCAWCGDGDGICKPHADKLRAEANHDHEEVTP